MKSRKTLIAIILIVLCSTVAFAAGKGMRTPDAAAQKADVMYQVATLPALQMGGFDGVVPVSELRTHGNIGIGTFDTVDGEMIVLDGTVYQALADGTIQKVADTTTVPFATVTFFEPDVKQIVTDVDSMATFTEKMDALIQQNGANNPYVVRLEGTFDHLLVRSVKPQVKPYQMLSEAMKTSQVEHTLDQVEGTIVGVYFPEYFSQMNLAGWHFHFITSDRLHGGHVLALNFRQAEAALDITTGFEMYLPQTGDFHSLDLVNEHVADVKGIESAE